MILNICVILVVQFIKIIRKIMNTNFLFNLSLLSYFIFVSTVLVHTQPPIDVAENTLKIGGLGEEILYFGFAEGDQVLFSFEEMNGKELKEIEFLEYPSSSKFMDYKTKKIENKTLNINRTGIYKFRFTNSAIAGRVCKIKIQRIPGSEQTSKFNTSVYWRTITDTSYTTIQENYLVKRDTVIYNITDQITKVHSSTNLNGNKETFNFSLPKNTVSWSYYIGVDQTGREAYDQATKTLTKSAAPLLSRMPGYGPLAALALGGVSYLSSIQKGEDIDYYLVPNDNISEYAFRNGGQFTYYKKGKVVNDFSRMNAPLNGTFFFCFMNDNAITGVEVSVKVTAIVVNDTWGKRPIQKMHLSKREEPYLVN